MKKKKHEFSISKENVWMDDCEIDLINVNLNLTKTMLEWGCGSSTLYFSQFVKELHSIENDKTWYNKIYAEARENNLDNVHLHYVETKPRPKENYNQSTYDLYANYIDMPDKIGLKYDVVLLDGRARRLCALKIMPFLNEHGVLIVHDYSIRPQYHCIEDYFNKEDEISDTPQTVATFTLKPNWQEIQGYKMSLGTFERLGG